jgi:hypothetical protein
MEKKFNLLVILCSEWDFTSSKYLFQNISKELFDLYLTADNKALNNEEDEEDKACAELNLDIEKNAIKIIDPSDLRLQNLHGVITVNINA